jgi:hypothetical protein
MLNKYIRINNAKAIIVSDFILTKFNSNFVVHE